MRHLKLTEETESNVDFAVKVRRHNNHNTHASALCSACQYDTALPQCDRRADELTVLVRKSETVWMKNYESS